MDTKEIINKLRDVRYRRRHLPYELVLGFIRRPPAPTRRGRDVGMDMVDPVGIPGVDIPHVASEGRAIDSGDREPVIDIDRGGHESPSEEIIGV